MLGEKVAQEPRERDRSACVRLGGTERQAALVFRQPRPRQVLQRLLDVQAATQEVQPVTAQPAEFACAQAGIRYALPPERRRTVLKANGVWAYGVARAPAGIEDAECRVADLATTDAAPSIQSDVYRFQRESRRYKAGLPHDLAPEEIELIERAHDDSRALLDTLAAAGPEDAGAAVSAWMTERGFDA